MKVAFLDFETQCADAAKTRATEVGVSLFNYENKKWTKETSFSSLMYEPDYPPQTPFIVELTGITDEMLKSQGKPRKEVFENGLLPILNAADVVVAHKTDFDWTIVKATCKLFDLKVPEKETLCSLTNFPWPKKYTCHKLSHLAYDHSILVDPATLHRADQDTDLLQLLMEKYDFDEVLAYARAPFVFLKAHTVGPWVDNGEQTGIARSVGFAWERAKGTNGPTFPKSWVGRFKEFQVESIKEEIAKSKSPFRITQIEGFN